MEQLVEQKPKSIKIIGFYLIISSICGLLFALYLQMYLGMIKSAETEETLHSSTDTLIIAYLAVFFTLLFIAALNFMKLKSWARLTLEIMTWIYLVQIVFKGGQLILNLASVSEDGSPDSGSIFSLDEVSLIWSSINLLFFTLSLIISLVILKQLRSHKIRAAMMPA